MKQTLFIFLWFLSILNANAQSNTILKPKLSANLQQYLVTGSSSDTATLVTNVIGNETYISALIKVMDEINDRDLGALGVKIGTRAGNIWTVQIPINKIREFINVSGIDYIQLDEPIAFTLDASRKATRVDSVHKGVGLPMGYSGKNVVVGIIDAGFDYSHPSFYDTTGRILRIKRVWEQKVDGTPPAGFSYGNEIKDTSQMLSKGTELSIFSHGTHVAGIAAGSGFGSSGNAKYRGMAYESDLVFVGIRPEKSEWKTSGMSSIIDGMSYIYNYAASVGKPAVVNLSWGCSIGPNDGTSLFSQACDNLTGKGKIFVLSAGNNGQEKIHLQKSFTQTDTVLNTFVNFDPSLDTKNTWVDIWGEPGKPFCVKLSLYNGSVPGNSTGTLCLNNSTESIFLLGSKNDTCFITITRISSDFNNKPHVLLDIHSKTGDNIGLQIESKGGTVHLWEGYVDSYRGYYGGFSNNGYSWAASGDVKYTLGEMASTRSAITVAAFASKNSFKNLSGSTISYSGYVVNNQIVPFSSHGPTADNRRKPDIAAPGLTIGSSVNSYDTSYRKGGGNYSSSVAKYTNPRNNRDYYYAESSGTSMASPAVSGIVALMLQAHPNLSPGDIKKIISETAIKDNFTTQKPDSSRWGAGKVNAYASLKRAILKAGILLPKPLSTTFRIIPNPNKGDFSIETQSINSEILSIEILNTLGQSVFYKNPNPENGYFKTGYHIESVHPGIYYVVITSSSGRMVSKLMVD